MAYTELTPNLEDLLGAIRAKLVRKARCSGLSPADAEDCAQDAITALLRLLARAPDRGDQAAKLQGWLFMKAHSLRIDRYRRAAIRAEDSLSETDDNGAEYQLQLEGRDGDLERRTAAREIIQLGFSPFFARLGGRGRSETLRCLLDLARRLFPCDQIEQFSFARTVVFSGKGPEKRSPEDLAELANSLGKTEGATMTELTRLQPQWKDAEREIFRPLLRVNHC